MAERNVAAPPRRRRLQVVPSAPQVLDVPVGDVHELPGLQARVAMNEDVVEDYAGLYREGRELPPIAVGRCDGVLYVYDGWHRLAARRCADLPTIACLVEDLDRAELAKRAIGANRDHGLRRTSEDKRRAVVLALMQPELCRLASRQLADVAGVSHAFVSSVRRSFGVDVGVPLTDAAVRRADGRPAASYEAIWNKASTWERAQVVQASWASEAADLVCATAGSAVWAATARRRAELASEPPPWGDSTFVEWASEATGADLQLAWRAHGVPDDQVQGLAAALTAVKEAGDPDRAWHAQYLLNGTVPPFYAALRAELGETAEQPEPTPRQRAEASLDAADADVAAIVAGLPADVLDLLHWRVRSDQPAGFRGAWLDRVSAIEGAHRCFNIECRSKAYTVVTPGSRCPFCGRDEDDQQEMWRDAVDLVVDGLKAGVAAPGLRLEIP